MRKKILIVLTLFLLSAGLTAQAIDSEVKHFGVSSLFTVVNNYYWRGDYFYPEGIPAFQPEATLTYEKIPLSLNVWTSFPLTRRSEVADIKDELDLEFSGDIIVNEAMTLTLGLEVYTFPFASVFSHTEELYTVFYWELPYGFGLDLEAYVDVNELKGLYIVFSPLYQLPLREGLDLEFKMLLGYSNYSSVGPRFKELGLRTSLSWQFSKYFSLNTAALYNFNYSASQHLYAVELGLGMGL